ncbi:alpha/beta fold hydrolase [Lentisphaera profundi]|uniref:Alpha/beta fold hydrolase n=1 Tax=Lentisphaera profundi TaxID=1658616 RepID=A0ABY7VUS1_9BACT|nr:alpha/beta fold hydrolase [Lentisphaera profundi]WDE97817.1 alpha/beta fold hydrolase [Lentisphaera profundi]
MKFENPSAKYECLLLHGLCEHEGRMYDLAKFLQKNDCQVHVPTHLGHGERALNSSAFKDIQNFYLNDSKDLDLLRHTHKGSELEKEYQYSRANVSMACHLQELEGDLKAIEAQSDKPIIIVGFSMGGLLALALAERYISKRISKLLLLSPALRVNIPKGRGVMKPVRLMANSVLQVFHELRYLNFPGMKSLGKYLSKAKLSIPCNEVTSNVCELRREQFIFQNDPLIAKRVPLSYLNAIQELMLELRSKDMSELSRKIKIGLAWSSGDSIVNPKEIKRFSRYYENSHLCIEDHACHDLLRAPCYEEVYDFIGGFLRS